MTRIYYDPDDGEEELQFHLELDETPPLAPPVAAFDIHAYHTHAHSESSWLPEGYLIGRTQASSRDSKPRSRDSLHFVWNHLDKAQSTPLVMAAQATEALNRTFIELKSKNEEVRLRASYDLRDLVVSAAKGKDSCSRCSVRSG